VALGVLRPRLHKGMTTWRTALSETRAAQNKLRGALASLNPEDRARRKAVKSWVLFSGQAAALRLAANRVLQANVLKHLRRWICFVGERHAGDTAMSRLVAYPYIDRWIDMRID